jgi:RimJ/RimL family protein N-acetyltransferase
MHPDARGKGLMTAAVRRVVRHAFDELGCRRLFLRAAAGNTASRYVAEQTGFRHVGTDRLANGLRDGTFEDLLNFDLLNTDKAVVESAG